MGCFGVTRLLSTARTRRFTTVGSGGVFAQIMAGLAAAHVEEKTVMFDVSR